jgi:hypothetical protein
MERQEFEEKYRKAYSLIKAELSMRDKVFPPGDARRITKMQEMEYVLATLVAFKDELKQHIPVVEQAALFPAQNTGDYER